MSSFSVLNNAQAASALFNLNRTQASLDRTQERINSGLRVGSAKDDASTYAVSLGMKNDVAGFKSIRETLALGRGTVGVALNATETVAGLLEKMKEKVVQAQSENVDRGAIQRDIAQFLDQIDTIVKSAQFNGVNLVGDREAAGGGKAMQVLASLDRASATEAPSPKFIEVAHVNMLTDELGKSEAARTQALSTINVDRKDLGKSALAETFTLNFADGGTPAADGDTVSITAKDLNGNFYKFTLTASTTGSAGSNIFDPGASDAATSAAIQAALATGAVLGTRVDDTGAVVQPPQSIAWSDMGLTAEALDLGTGTPATAAFRITATDEGKGFSIVEVAGDVALATSAQTFKADPASILNGFETSRITLDQAFVADEQVNLRLYKQNGEAINIAVDGAVFGGTAATLAQGLIGEIAAQGYEASELGIAIVADPATQSVTVRSLGQAGGVAVAGFSVTSTDAAATDDDILAAREKGRIANERPFAMTLEAEIEKVEQAISQVQVIAASFGSVSQRLELQSQFMDSLINTLNEGISTLIDANMAEESARFQALQVQQQLGLQALSIANGAPQAILSLFQG